MKKSQTTWQMDDLKVYPPLNENIMADVVIVGAGITGITTAYLLAKEGRNVVVVDKGDLNETVSAYTTAFITYVVDTQFVDLINMFGREKAIQVFESKRRAIDLIEKNMRECNFTCEFKRVPMYSFGTDEKQASDLKEDAEEACKGGFPLKEIEGVKLPFPNFGGIETPFQAKFHPVQYLSCLKAKAHEKGVRFYDQTEVVRIEGEKTITVHTAKPGTNGKDATGPSIIANNVVVATYKPMVEPGLTKLKKGTYITYVFELSIPTETFPEALYEDGENPYHYFRVDKGLGVTSSGKVDPSLDRLIIGGEDHRQEIPIDEDKNYSALEEYTKKILGDIPYTIVRRWNGPIIEPSDGLALIGRYDKKHPNHYSATGFSGNGMTYGTLAGMMFADMILGRKNEYEELYNPRRTHTLRSILYKGRDYTEELIHGALKNSVRRTKSKGKTK
ncbi:MAG: FAD-binding oxidoreductase [Patescibacteria group bacterium]